MSNLLRDEKDTRGGKSCRKRDISSAVVGKERRARLRDSMNYVQNKTVKFVIIPTSYG